MCVCAHESLFWLFWFFALIVGCVCTPVWRNSTWKNFCNGLCAPQLFPDASLVKASAPESRSATQVAPLEISDSWAVRPRTCCCCCQQSIIAAVFHPLPFPAPSHHRVVQQTIETFLFWSLHRLQICLVQQFTFHAATKPFHAKITRNITLCTVHTQKVRNVYGYCEVLPFFSTKQHVYITTSIYLLQEALI